MAIRLEKGQKINLEKSGGSKLTNFCVGCNWGAIKAPRLGGLLGLKTKDVDLDLSCIMSDAEGKMRDHIYSPLFKPEMLAQFNLPPGKLDSFDRALHHSGDDRSGDTDGDDGLDNEIITVDLDRVQPEVEQIFFFLNIYNKSGEDWDFSQIPYATIRMYEGTPSKVQTVFAQYDVAASPQYKGMYALIMGKLYYRNNDWKFAAIGDAFPDRNIIQTIKRILHSYTR